MSVAATRFGHTEERVCLAFHPKNHKIVSVGSDGEMRVWTGIEDDDCENYLIGDRVLSMCASDTRIYTGVSGTNVVSGYNWEGESEGVIGPRFTADVTALACTRAGDTVLVAGAEDFTVKVINTSSFTTVSLEPGHAAPVLSVDITNTGDTVVSSSCDGSVKVWSVSNKSVITTLDNVHPKSNDVPNSSTVCGLKFSPNGEYLAVPKGKSVLLLEKKKDWKQSSSCNIDLADGEVVTCVEWDNSESGPSYLIAATNKGNLSIVSFPSMKVSKIIPSERKQNICSIVHHPEKSEAIFADLGGHWGLIEDLSSSGGSSKTEAATADDEDMEALFNDDDDDENSFSVAKVAAQAGYTKDADGNLTFSGEGGDNDERPSSVLSNVSNATPGYRDRPPPPAPRARLQSPFQPGASPEGLSNRFLVYNSVGVVKSHESEAERSIDVEFHDIAVHHALHLANNDQFSMAALSSTLLALATTGPGHDDEVGAKLSVNYFSSSDINKEWSVTMTDKEEKITGVAVGSSWVALATSRHHLRMFTAGGMQREVVMMPGPLVTMVGDGDNLMLVYHDGHPLPGQQSLSYVLYTCSITGTRVRQAGHRARVPLSPDSDLYWAGFSDTRTPVITDTCGWTRALDTSTWLWHPVINSRDHVRGKSDFHYVISVSHVESVLRCVLCKGCKYPPTVPRPLPIALPLEAPLVSLQSEKGGLEQTSVNLSLQSRFLSSCPDDSYEVNDSLETVRQKEIETMMKLFALACKSDHESRAMEVARLLPSVETVQLAIQYAAKIRRLGLAEKLGKLAMEKQEQEEVSQEVNEDHHDDNEEESEDMFAATQENPLLAAAAKRDNSSGKSSNAFNITTQGKQESRNPFAKKVANSGSTGPGSPSQSGIVFDSLKVDKSSTGSSNNKEVSGFGQRKIVLNTQDKLKQSKKTLIPKEKENRSDNSQGAIKGFQLYFAENKDSFDDEGSALTQWKTLDKLTKEGYQVPRIPNTGDGAKRKREGSDGDVGDDGKKLKTGVNAKQKLAGFAFNGN